MHFLDTGVLHRNVSESYFTQSGNEKKRKSQEANAKQNVAPLFFGSELKVCDHIFIRSLFAINLQALEGTVS